MSSMLNICLSISEEVPLLKHINSKSNFLSLMINSFSHEIKTPLTKILMLIDIAFSGKDSPVKRSTLSAHVADHVDNAAMPMSKYKSDHILLRLAKTPKKAKYESATQRDSESSLKRIRDISTNLLYFINGIMDFGKVVNNRIDITKKSFNVLEMINEVVNSFESQLIDKALEKIIDCDPLADMNSDRKLIQEVLFILIDNALKFTSSGGIRIKFNIDAVMKKYTFKIIDTGCGCSVEDLAAIQKILTEPFATERKTKSSAGLGIGLRTAQALIVSMSNGSTTLNFTSKRREGTTVGFSIPIHDSDIRVPTIIKSDCLYPDDSPVPVNSRIFSNDTFSAESGSRTKKLETGFEQDRIGLSQLVESPIIARGRLAFAFGDIDDALIKGLSTMVKPRVTLDLEFNLSKIYDYDTWSSKEHTELVESKNSEITRMIAKSYMPEILIVDDDYLITELLSEILSNFGVYTREAQSGEEALSICDKLLFSQTPLSMVITDFNMPNMNGAELAKALMSKEYNPIMKNVPIIALSAQDEPTTRDICREAGIKEFLAKPILQKDLESLLNRYRLIKNYEFQDLSPMNQ